MPTEDFSLDQFITLAKDVIIELVPSDQRIKLLTGAGADSEDTGHRLHSYFPQWPTFPLDQAGRREIHQGLLKWSNNIDLVNQVTHWEAWHKIEDEYLARLQSKRGKLDRVYVVRGPWRDGLSLSAFEHFLAKVRAESGGSHRLSIPKLVISLALNEHLSLSIIHSFLQRLYYERQDQYFFESASRQLLPTSPVELGNYVRINGAWRTSLVFTT